MEENEEDEHEDEENKFVTRDTCYHLLKLYCKRSHRLERLLSPSTSTAHQLDFSLRYSETLCVAELSWSQDHNLQESVIAGWGGWGITGCTLSPLRAKSKVTEVQVPFNVGVPCAISNASPFGW